MVPSKTELYYAQAILLGMTICGARFGTLLQVILEPSPDRGTSDFANEEAILLLSTRWKLLSSDEFIATKICRAIFFRWNGNFVCCIHVQMKPLSM